MQHLKAPSLPPGRAEVAVLWQALAAGTVTREAVHGWAAPWVESDEASGSVSPLVLTALQHLHGFDLCRDPSSPSILWHGMTGEGQWTHSRDDITVGFARWLRACDLHDADPQGWSKAIREQARAGARPEDARPEQA
ncbi:hypothetical protein ACGFSG_35820 [Streptomyces sp. NPDC048512]|uniref:hypothetical protein n=1 Tax=Streptomyces sp. NPDC048512 TaxID=3365563 RepID=UPI003723E955